MKNRSTLKRALTFHFLLVAVCPILIFGLIAIVLMQNQIVADLQERNQLLAADISDETSQFLFEVLLDLQNVRSVYEAADVIEPGKEDVFLEMLVRNSQFFESIYILDMQRRVKFLGLLPKLIPRKEDYRFLDFSSHALFLDDPSLTEPVWSDSFISVISGEPSVTLAMPLPDGESLFGNISLSRLSRLLGRYSTDGKTQFAIVDHQGTLLAHSTAELAMQRLNFSDYELIDTVLRGLADSAQVYSEDSGQLESVSQIALSGWVVWASADMQSAMVPLRNLRNLLLGFMTLAISLAAGMALFNARRLMRPLAALAQRTGLVAEGRYELGFDPSGFMEIDDLAENFRGMSVAVNERETSILESEKRFRDLVNSIDGIVRELDYPSMQFRFVSRQAEPILGYPLQDWLAKRTFWEDHLHEEDRLQAVAYSRLMTEQRKDHDFEYRMTTADGRIVWIRDLVTVVVNEDQSVSLFGVMLDVTSKKEVEQELRRSEQNYREIFNATGEAILIHDPHNGQILDVNHAMLKVFGYTAEETREISIEDISEGKSPYSQKEAIELVRKAYEEGETVFDWRARRKNGELFWAEVALKAAEIGGEERVLSVVRDVSERVQARLELQELNERLRLLIDRMPLGCIVWSPDFSAEMWNPAAEQIFGFSSQEMLGRTPVGTILPEDAHPHVDQIWSRLLEGDVSAHSENANLTSDGRTITCEWYNTPLRRSDGQVTGVISMVQDISERKVTEEELKRYRAHLEELVARRTEELQEAQAELVQKERLAVLGQLTTTVSHEIRNPLGTVMNALYLIRNVMEGQDLQALERPLELAERNVQRCDGIISELLDFSKRREVKMIPLDVDQWLEQLLDEIVCPETVSCPRDLHSDAMAMADPERLRRAVVNVIVNALQVLEEDAAVDALLEVVSRVSDGRCEILVRDNGAGIADEMLERIFEPMFSTKTFGVGLGVPIIKNIMEDHGGGVDYQSKVGEGTLVTLWLPVIEEEPPDVP